MHTYLHTHILALVQPHSFCTLTLPSLLFRTCTYMLVPPGLPLPSRAACPPRCGLWDDGGLHVHWHLLQRGDLPRLLLLLLLHDAGAALDLLHQPLEHARLLRGAGRRQWFRCAPPQPHPAPQPHAQAHQPQRGVLEVPAPRGPEAEPSLALPGTGETRAPLAVGTGVRVS